MQKIKFKMQNDQRGVVSLAAVLIVVAAAMAMALSVQSSGLNELLLAYGSQRSEEAFQVADSCVEEAMLRLRSDNAYTGGTLSVGRGTCIIAVTGVDSTRTVVIEATVGTITRNLRVDVSVSGVSSHITGWQEDIE